ncbi:MAG: arginine N-succinyltransferase [Gammaproteobacteria bacterium]|jgi:arginine N-succinyltransferase|nr:arginine N-succinyltransferase [Gammaproteobacteria bacterium]
MLIVRPIQQADKAAFHTFAKAAGVGHTNLPQDNQQLQTKLDHSALSFSSDIAQAGEESYQFVLEDLSNQTLAGTCAIDACIGLSQPNYSYRLATMVHASKQLKLVNRAMVLQLSHDYTGVSRLSAFYLSPEYRHSFHDQLLSKARLMFMARFPERFSGTTIAEIKGVIDDQHISPFWESVGRHFFTMDFAEADLLTGTSNKAFIADLMPRHPLYVELLPAPAQAVIGQHHKDFEDVVNILEHEGLRFVDQVDIFDAGPMLEARTRLIRTIRKAEYSTIAIDHNSAHSSGSRVLLSNNQCQDFRCLLARKQPDSEVISIQPQTAQALGVSDGEQVLYSPL